MTSKLRCTVTGNWAYCSDERYQKLVKKYGGEAELLAKYVSRAGKKVQEEGGSAPDAFKNKIECTVTGELCYISDARLKKLIKKAGSEQAVREAYVSRVAKRLMKEGMNKADIKSMAKDGKLPAPTGIVKAPKAPKVPKAPKAPKVPAKDVVKDTVPADATTPAKVTEPVAAKKSTKKSAKKRSR